MSEKVKKAPMIKKIPFKFMNTFWIGFECY